MKTRKAAKRYALALFQLAEERKTLDPVHKNLEALAKLIQESPELVRFLLNPILSHDRQRTILDKLFKGKLHAQTLSFLHFLAEHKKLSYLEEIAAVFSSLYGEKKGILRAELSSVVPLHAEQLHGISEKLKKAYSRDIELSTRLEVDLLGGFKIQIEDFIYDFSVKEQLRHFKHAVLAA